MAHSLFHSQLPLWFQVAQSLRAEIHASTHTEPLRIPTEIELALKYSVSVITIRQSLKSLQQEGLIYRQRRHGTFAHPNKAAAKSLKLLGIADSIIAQYAAQPTEVFARTEISPPHSVAALFSDTPTIFEFRRKLVENGEVSAYLVNYVHPLVGKSITTEMAAGSMTKAIKDQNVAQIAHFSNTVSAVLPSPFVAEILRVELVSPILFYEGVCKGDGGVVLDVAHVYYRADKYKFTVEFAVPSGN
jgi:GntR family transcriptional regulator